MAEDVGNLRIRLGLTGTEFTQQLATVNRELNNFGATLREQASRTDGFGQSMDGLRARSETLTNQMTMQRQKIDILNTALQQAITQHGAYSREAQTLQGRVTNATTALNRMQGQLNQTNQSMEDLNNASQNSGGKLDSLKEGLANITQGFGAVALSAGTVAVGLLAIGAAAAGGLLIKSVQVTDELHKALNGLQAQTGETDEEMKGMRDTMLAIYNNNFGENFEEIGKAMAYVHQQTNLTGEALKITTQNAFALKDTFGIEIEDSIKATTSMMKNFGLTSDEAMNLLAQGAQKGLNKNGDLSDIIAEYGPHFATLGISAEKMFNILNNGATQGIFSFDQLGDAVHEFGIRGKDGSKTTADAFVALGLDAAKTTADIAAGGDRAGAAFETVTQKLNSMQDPQARYAAGVALFGTMWEEVQSKGMLALTDTTKGIDGAVNALQKINEIKYDTFGEALTGIGRNLETAIVIPIGEKVLPILGKFTDYIIANMPQIQSFISSAMDQAGAVIDKLANIVQSTLMPIFEKLSAWVQANLPKIKETFSNTFDIISTKVIPSVVAVFQSLTSNVLPVVADRFDYITKNIIPPLVEIIKFVYSEIVPQLAAKFQEFIPKIVEVMDEMWTTTKPIIDNLVSAFKIAWPIIKEAVKIAIDLISELIKGVLTVLKGLIQFISGVFTGDWNRAWTGIKTMVGGIIDAIIGIIKTLVNKLVEYGGQFVTSLANGFTSKVSGFMGNISNFINEIISKFRGTDLYQIGVQIIQGLLNGISNMAYSVYNKAREIANSIKNTISSALQINSPSRVMMEVGSSVPEGLAEGISNKKNMVINTMKGISTDIKVGASSGISNLTNAIQNSTGNISINLVVDGKTLANVIAPHQYASQRSYSRGVGIA